MPSAIRIPLDEHDRLVQRARWFGFLAGAVGGGIGATVVVLALYGWGP